MRWSEQETVKFVELYRDNECLWNMKNVNFKNKQVRYKALDYIAKKMGKEDFGIKEAKKKIKNIRSTYGQEIVKIKKSKQPGNSQTNVYVPSVRWFNIMDVIMKKKDHKEGENASCEYFDFEDAIESSSVPDITLEVGDEIHHSPIKKEVVDVYSPIDETIEYSFEEPPEKKFKETPVEESRRKAESTVVLTHGYEESPGKKFNENPAEECRRIPESTGVLNHLVDQKVNKNTTEFDVFGCSVAAQLNNMPFENALELQLEVQQVITKYRLNMYRKNVQSTVPSSSSQTPSNIMLCDSS
ncbi:UNVERIFIED_CONTAM: hypothetical protein RMT77_003580 [Armadillidium vulgare]